MHYVVFTCDEDSCQTGFAVDSFNTTGDETCPNCGGDATNTGEVIVDPDIMGESTARDKGLIV